MSHLFRLTTRKMRQLDPYLPISHGVPRVDDRWIVSGIIFVVSNGLRWRPEPIKFGPHETIYNRFMRWSHLACSIASLQGSRPWAGSPTS